LRTLLLLFNIAADILMVFTLGKDTGNQAKSAGRCERNYSHRFYLVLKQDAFFRYFTTGPDKKLRVCDVCGSYLSIFDSDK
jgi:hypothetical protein